MDFDRIYAMYFKDVYLYLRSMTVKEDMAEEIAQEVFVKALKAIDSFDGTKDIRAWLFTIAKNTYFTYCKRHKIYVEDGVPEQWVDPSSYFTEQIEDEERALQIHRYLHTMQDPYKEVFTLRIFGDLSFEKIGLIFGKSPGWARVTYHRARKQIIEYMEELEHE